MKSFPHVIHLNNLSSDLVRASFPLIGWFIRSGMLEKSFVASTPFNGVNITPGCFKYDMKLPGDSM